MRPDTETRWWNMFTPEGSSATEESCPVLPVDAGPGWQKSLVNLYCPCRSDSTAYECQLLLT